ncbi:MAG: hypothetical protein B6229_08805 [Spirochaetaceae bacterium 4572_7]|nr:MAG: hypothetical protein B6229_08805 [Spirochaetaceae bacterium 4572_7]
MFEIDINESLNLYFMLSEKVELSDKINLFLIRLEKELFAKLSVKEIEDYRVVFKNKGRV